MTPRERLNIAASGGQSDRVPVVYYAFGGSRSILRRLGLTWQDIFYDAENITKVMTATYALWGHDNVCAFLSPVCGIDALGIKVVIPRVHVPHVEYTRKYLANLKDLTKLRVPDPLRDGSMPARIEAAKMLDKALGHEVEILGGFGGISTWAIFLRGFRDFVVDSFANQSFQEKYMNFLTDCAIEFCLAQVRAGCGWIISEEDVFMSAMGPELSWSCTGQYLKRLVDAVHKAGAHYIVHCCGDLTLTIERILETGADMLSIDKTDLTVAKKKVGDRAALMGNIKLSTLVHGSVGDVEEACQEAIRKIGSRARFVLSAGYIYPFCTPFENIKTLVESAKKYSAGSPGSPLGCSHPLELRREAGCKSVSET